jgi:hypothetical protein
VAKLNVVVNTNAPDTVEFRSIRKFSDGSGFSCVLKVASRGFAAERDFYFDQAGLERLVSGVSAMNRDLRGCAEIRTPYEDDKLSLELLPNGSVIVSGELHEHSDLPQKLQFSFKTDQTCLESLVRDLGSVLEMPST